MKKTFITAFALASSAMGADLVAEWDNFSNNLTYTNISDENSVDYKLILKGNSKVSGEDLTVDGSNPASVTLDIKQAGLTMSNGLTIHMQVKGVKNFGGNPPYTLFCLSDANDPYLFCAGIMNEETNPVKFAYNGSVNNISTSVVTNSNNSNLLSTDTFSYVTVTIKDGDLKFYVDGEVVATSSKTNLSSKTLTTIALGSWVGDSSNALADYTLGSLAVYNGAMNEKEVANLIPEPTTATLSLLALAGLAMRRRRK